jgi:hypothetical protein
MSEKIKGHQLERGAYVYVRQSTPYQVRNHLESKERQYALADRAEQLGFCKVVVIDEDLGRSGTGTQKGRASAAYWRPSARVWPERC